VPRGPQPRTRGDPLGLTARERQIFELARRGLSTAELARSLHRSERTVENHVAAMYRKLGVNTRAQLMTRHPAAPAAEMRHETHTMACHVQSPRRSG
jgi:DNA-binding CsgD family transcriptional regulator